METMRVGVSIIKQLSTAFYRRKTMVLEELIANAYDAGASYAKIAISNDSIVVLDDGEGMSPDQLTKFFYISYTEKNKKSVKEIRDKLKRYIIGKFGIGKLSMYQLCRQFVITTWKDGFESSSQFNFDDFEKKEFVDEIELFVESKKVDIRKHGTEIRLEKLRPDSTFDVKKLRRDLAHRMLLNPDFKIYINNVTLASPEHLSFHKKYPVDETVSGIGPVKGEIKILLDPSKDDTAGIYVRVKGRVINHDPRIVDFSTLKSPNFTARRIWGVLDADGLEAAVQSNRSDFVKDDPRYERFVDWLSEKLKKITQDFSKTKYIELKTDQEKGSVPTVMKQYVLDSISGPDTKRDELQNRKIDIKKAAKNFDLVDIGQDGPEAVFDEKKGLVEINTAHPMYKQARKRRCLEYHVMVSSIVVIAAKLSSNVDEFLDNYAELIKHGKIPEKFRKN